MPPTIIFYTLQTSATASIWRILRSIDRGARSIRQLGEERFAQGSDFSFAWTDIPFGGQLVSANCHYHLKPIDDRLGHRFLVNFRDPRDRLCNEFMWNLIHPFRPDETPQEIEARAAKLRDQGIDAWVRGRAKSSPLTDLDYYQYFMRNVDRIPKQNRTVNSYARLCLDFDSFVDRSCTLLGVEPTHAIRQAVEPERTDNLEHNPRWIGHQWEGSDIMPGRYKSELRPETIAFLSEKYAPVLQAMAVHDPDYAHLYLENVDELGNTPPPAPWHRPKPSCVSRPVVRHNIVNRADLRIDHFRQEKASEDVVFVLFERVDANIEAAVETVLDSAMDVVAISTATPLDSGNFPAGDLAEIQRWLSWRRRPYRHRLGLLPGVAAGSALALSKMLRLDRILGLFPLSPKAMNTPTSIGV